MAYKCGWCQGIVAIDDPLAMCEACGTFYHAACVKDSGAGECALAGCGQDRFSFIEARLTPARAAGGPAEAKGEVGIAEGGRGEPPGPADATGTFGRHIGHFVLAPAAGLLVSAALFAATLKHVIRPLPGNWGTLVALVEYVAGVVVATYLAAPAGRVAGRILRRLGLGLGDDEGAPDLLSSAPATHPDPQETSAT